jgi:hypothetical protein
MFPIYKESGQCFEVLKAGIIAGYPILLFNIR